jgi:hypothetical protein
MALWSFFVEVGGAHFSSQARGDTPSVAIGNFLGSGSIEGFTRNKFSFTPEDIVLFIPMDGLVNMHLCQVGRRGEYASITMALTVEAKQI